jgi:2-dehydro-3-deoxygalactonokinase
MPSAATPGEFLSCDWGTTTFRLRRVRVADGAVLGEVREPQGARSLHAQGDPSDAGARARRFAAFLTAQAARLVSLPETPPPLRVVVSGMASSSVGWHEIPYATTPFPLDGTRVRTEWLPAGRLHVCLLSGVTDGRDMMRGEETELLGLFASGRHPAVARDGWVILPGTHSKHLRLRDGALQSIHTFMTGELFDVLSHHSLLKATVTPPEALTAEIGSDAAARQAFVEGVEAARTEGLPASLFQARARTVLQQASPDANGWFLSGLLIGSELVTAGLGPQDPPLLLAAPGATREPYQLALEVLGLLARATVVPAAEQQEAGIRAHRMLLALQARL